jgi:hypothetical protein
MDSVLFLKLFDEHVKSRNVHDVGISALPGRNLSMIDHALPGQKLSKMSFGRLQHVHVWLWNNTTA